MATVEALIQQLGLQPHPEGGYYKAGAGPGPGADVSPCQQPAPTLRPPPHAVCCPQSSSLPCWHPKAGIPRSLSRPLPLPPCGMLRCLSPPTSPLQKIKPHMQETFRDPGTSGGRSHSTAILYLLPAGARSKLHRLDASEVWHFYLGGPLTVVEVTEAGVKTTTLGQDLAGGQDLQHVVPPDTWFGAAPCEGTGYALVGCTVGEQPPPPPMLACPPCPRGGLCAHSLLPPAGRAEVASPSCCCLLPLQPPAFCSSTSKWQTRRRCCSSSPTPRTGLSGCWARTLARSVSVSPPCTPHSAAVGAVFSFNTLMPATPLKRHTPTTQGGRHAASSPRRSNTTHQLSLS